MPAKFAASNIGEKDRVYHGRGVGNCHYKGRNGFSYQTVDRLPTFSKPKSLLVIGNKYSVLPIDQTNDIGSDNNHKKGIELLTPQPSPKTILR